MILMPSAESFTMWAIPREVSCISAHKTLTFLLLVMIHGLCHLEGQSLYAVWFEWGALHRIRVWWEQVYLNSSCASHGGRILLVTIMGVMSRSSSFGRTAWVVSHFKFLGQMIGSVEAGVCLFPLRQIGHGKAQCIPQAGGKSIVEVISSQTFPFIWHLVRVHAFLPLLLLHGLLACTPPQFHVLSGEFHTTTGSCYRNHTCFRKCGPYASVSHSTRCSYPLVVSEPISQGNLVGYQRCGVAYSFHHTDPASLVHQSTRFHRSHQHWHLWNEIWVDSILPVPVSFLPAGISYAYGIHWTRWLLNNHRNLLLQSILGRKVVIPLLLLLLLE